MPCVRWNVQRNFHRHLNSNESQILTLCYVWVYDITHASWHPFYHRNWFVPIFSFFHVIVLYAYLCLFKHCLYAHILCISCKFVYTYHTFIPQLVFVLILLDPFVIHDKKWEKFWTSVHMHRRRYIDKGRLT